MVDAPEKIWANGLGCYGTTGTDGTEYTRSDLVAELAAENERLKREVENWKTSAAGWRKIAKANTSAVKVSYANSTAPNRPFATTPPEGQQEPVAYRVTYANGDDVFLTDKPLGDSGVYSCAPLYTRPSEQVVTDEIAEAASREYMRIFGKHLLIKHARLILTAALEAGHD